jgi:uncharacterized protein (TIGR02996 family)
MITRTMPEAFLADIIAHPADDAPRLIYADWLEENGQPERAEFIRVQCRLLDAQPWPPMSLEDMERLQKRERELLKANHQSWGDLPIVFVPRLSVEPLRQNNARYRRGFIADICCTADDWLAHADALTAAQPIEAVTLTTWPRPRFEERTPGICGPMRLRGRKRWIEFDSLSQYDDLELSLLAAEWPNIAFTLPVRGVVLEIARVRRMFPPRRDTGQLMPSIRPR